MHTQHGRAVEGIRSWTARNLGKEPRTYRISLPTVGGPRKCPVGCCPGRVAMRMDTWVQFLHRNVRDTVVILEEGKLPRP